MNPKVDFYFNNAKKWRDEINALRSIVLDCGLVEELKWGAPCYTFQKGNVVLIHVFKDYCALLFFKGALLKDPKGILIQQTANVQAARQVRFTHVDQIIKMARAIRTYVRHAVEVEQAGLKVELKKTNDFDVSVEFKNELNKNASLKTAFSKLTPGRQRAYLLYFSQAKQSKTRESRIEKYIPHILDGKGLDD